MIANALARVKRSTVVFAAHVDERRRGRAVVIEIVEPECALVHNRDAARHTVGQIGQTSSPIGTRVGAALRIGIAGGYQQARSD